MFEEEKHCDCTDHIGPFRASDEIIADAVVPVVPETDESPEISIDDQQDLALPRQIFQPDPILHQNSSQHHLDQSISIIFIGLQSPLLDLNHEVPIFLTNAFESYFLGSPGLSRNDAVRRFPAWIQITQRAIRANIIDNILYPLMPCNDVLNEIFTYLLPTPAHDGWFSFDLTVLLSSYINRLTRVSPFSTFVFTEGPYIGDPDHWNIHTAIALSEGTSNNSTSSSSSSSSASNANDHDEYEHDGKLLSVNYDTSSISSSSISFCGSNSDIHYFLDPQADPNPNDRDPNARVHYFFDPNARNPDTRAKVGATAILAAKFDSPDQRDRSTYDAVLANRNQCAIDVGDAAVLATNFDNDLTTAYIQCALDVKTYVPLPPSFTNDQEPDTLSMVATSTFPLSLLCGETNGWFLDSGATAHITSQQSSFTSYNAVIGRSVGMVTGANTPVVGEGSVVLPVQASKLSISGVTSITLQNVLHVPGAAINLVSVSKLSENSIITFSPLIASIKFADGVMITARRTDRGLYQLPTSHHLAATVVVSDSDLLKEVIALHCSLAHINLRALQRLLRKKLVPSSSALRTFALRLRNLECPPCLVGKMTTPSLPDSAQSLHHHKTGQHACSDTCGPFSASIHGFVHAVCFIDISSSFAYVGFMRRNDAATLLRHLQHYTSMARTSTSRRLLLFQMDNGHEFDNNLVETFCKENLIHRQFSAPYRQGMNGKAERLWRTLEEGVIALLDQAGAPLSYWALAMSAMVHVCNILPARSSRRSSFRRFMQKLPPPISSLHPFGCAAYALIDRNQQGKLGSKSDPCIFLGYSSRTIGSYVVRKVSTGAIVVRRDVKFRNAIFPMKIANQLGRPLSLPLHVELPHLDDEENQLRMDFGINDSPICEEKHNQPVSVNDADNFEEEHCPAFEEEEAPPLAWNNDTEEPFVWSRRQRTVPPIEEEKNFTDIDDANILPDDAIRSNALSALAADDHMFCSGGRRLAPSDLDLVAMVAAAKVCHHDHEPDPATLSQAMHSPNWPHWERAIKEEMNSLKQNNTYEVVTRKPGMKCIGTKLVLKTKFEKGQLTRYKARLTAQGFKQEYGINYFNTFAPTMKSSSLRMVLSIALDHDLQSTQMDIKTAFLVPTLPSDEVIFVNPPTWLKMPNHLVWRLLKGLYGVKQAAHLFYRHLKATMAQLELLPSPSDPCVFVRSGPSIEIAAVWVDDIILVASPERTTVIKNFLETKYKMTGGDTPSWVLGIEVVFSKQSLQLTQRSFIKQVLQKFNMENCHPQATPAAMERLTSEMSPSNDEEKDRMQKIPYRQLLGSLMYIATQTRPDISFSVGQAAKFAHNPGPRHWTALKRILRYLKGTMELCLTYTKTGKPEIQGYSDSDWAGDVDTRRSTTGCVFIRLGGAILWKSSQQKGVALSSTEAELVAISNSARKALWVRRSMKSMNCRQISPTIIFEDNQGTIAISGNERITQRTSHIEVRHFFIRECVQNNEIIVEYCHTSDMVADILTKPTVAAVLIKLRALFGILPRMVED